MCPLTESATSISMSYEGIYRKHFVTTVPQFTCCQNFLLASTWMKKHYNSISDSFCNSVLLVNPRTNSQVGELALSWVSQLVSPSQNSFDILTFKIVWIVLNWPKNYFQVSSRYLDDDDGLLNAWMSEWMDVWSKYWSTTGTKQKPMNE